MDTNREYFLTRCLNLKLRSDPKFKRSYLEHTNDLWQLASVLKAIPSDAELLEKLDSIFAKATLEQLLGYRAMEQYAFDAIITKHIKIKVAEESSIDTLASLYPLANSDEIRELFSQRGSELLTLKDVPRSEASRA